MDGDCLGLIMHLGSQSAKNRKTKNDWLVISAGIAMFVASIVITNFSEPDASNDVIRAGYSGTSQTTGFGNF